MKLIKQYLTEKNVNKFKDKVMIKKSINNMMIFTIFINSSKHFQIVINKK